MKRIFSLILAIILLLGSIFIVSAKSEKPIVQKESILSALYEADITQIREAIDQRMISCEELTAYYIQRIQKYNKSYNCFITLCDDALLVAKERDKALLEGKNTGALFGVPVVIKDNMNLKRYYTTNGHPYSESTIAQTDAHVVSLLLKEGAIIVGKTNMSTDAQDARTSYSKIKGETKNAYNTLLSAGGSSGGTASAVSLNFSVAGLGTDTNSSLRIPAILNGCVSLRPTIKKISFAGCTHLNNSRDVIGAVTRTVYDQAIMLDVLTENKYAYERNLNSNAVKGLRLGIVSELTYAVDKSVVTEPDEEIKDAIIKKFDVQYRTDNYIDKEIASAFENAVTNLESCGAETVTISIPEIFDWAYPTFLKHDFSIKDEFYNKIKDYMKQNDLDALIFPTYLSTPLKTGRDSSGKNWNVWSQVFLNNCRIISPSTGMPEMSLLIGNHSSGAGIGMEIVSYKNSEQLLLNIAYTYTQRYNHREIPSGAPDMYSSWNIGSLEKIANEYSFPALSDRVIEMEIKTTTSTTSKAPTETSGTEILSTEIESATASQSVTQSTIPTEEDSTNQQTDNTEKDKPSIVPIIILSLLVLVAGLIIIFIIKKRKQ